MNVGIIGGSIGGMTAALVLRDAGCLVEVFERSPTKLRGYGAGLGMHAATTRYSTERLGVDWDVLSIAAVNDRYIDREGRVVYEAASRQRLTSWTTLHRHLMTAYGDSPYHAGHQLVDLETNDDGARVTFANGVSRSFDLVVASDGIGSTARQLLFPQVTVSPSGYVGWRGIVVAERLGETLFERLSHDMTYFIGNRSHMLSYPIPGEGQDARSAARAITFAWYRNVAGPEELRLVLTDREGIVRDLTVPSGYVAPERRSELVGAAVRDLPPAFADLVSRTDRPFVAVIGDLEVPRMVRGRVVLIGDAAFTARPHTAAGTAKVAHDAWTLGETIAAAGARADLVNLDGWESEQMALGRALVARSRQWGERAQRLGSWLPGDPDLRTGLFGPGR